MTLFHKNRTLAAAFACTALFLLLGACERTTQVDASVASISMTNVYHKNKESILTLGMQQAAVEAQLGEGVHEARFDAYSYDTLTYGQGAERISISYADSVVVGFWLYLGEQDPAASPWYLVQTYGLGQSTLFESDRAPEYRADDGSIVGYSYRFDESEHLADPDNPSSWRYELNVFYRSDTQSIYALSLFASPAFGVTFPETPLPNEGLT